MTSRALDQSPVAPESLHRLVSKLFRSTYDFPNDAGSYHVGGFSYVFRAIKHDTREVVALKLPRVPTLLAAEGIASSGMEVACDPILTPGILLAETSLLRHLGQQPGLENIPRLIEAGTVKAPDSTSEPVPFLVTQWLPYGTIHEIIPSVGQERPREFYIQAARVVGRLARTVAALHRCPHAESHGTKGYIHRDIKPTNILFGTPSRDVPILIDYGLCIRSDTAVLDGLLGRLQPAGTALYMSPEQATPDRPIGPASDVFSLGLLLFELVSGISPWRIVADTSESDALMQIATCKLQRLEEVDGRVPTELCSICNSVMVEVPEARGSAAGLAERLERFASGNPTSQPPVATVPSMGRRWTRWLLTGTALVLIIAAILVICELVTGCRRQAGTQQQLDAVERRMLADSIAEAEARVGNERLSGRADDDDLHPRQVRRHGVRGQPTGPARVTSGPPVIPLRSARAVGPRPCVPPRSARRSTSAATRGRAKSDRSKVRRTLRRLDR